MSFFYKTKFFTSLIKYIIIFNTWTLIFVDIVSKTNWTLIFWLKVQKKFQGKLIFWYWYKTSTCLTLGVSVSDDILIEFGKQIGIMRLVAPQFAMWRKNYKWMCSVVGANSGPDYRISTANTFFKKKILCKTCIK